MCLFALAPYYKLNKGFFLGFLLKPLGGLRPPRGLNKKALEKYPLFITYFIRKLANMSQNLSSAAVVIGALRVNIQQQPVRLVDVETCLEPCAFT